MRLHYFRIFATILALSTFARVAFANPEPTAYDSRSIGMGLTGVTYLERPAALAINPANLEGINKFSVSLLFNPLFVFQQAPVSGPNSDVKSGLGFGPLGSVFFAGRASPRIVMGGGVYIETGYGSSFSNVKNIDGTTTGTGDTNPARGAGNGSGAPGTDPNLHNLSVTFFVGEAALGGSVRVNKKLKIGLAMRFPFAIQDANLYQNIGAALNMMPGSGPGLSSYAAVKNHLSGIGFPSPRVGITYNPVDWVTLGASYRAYASIPLTGTTTTDLGAGTVQGPATAQWRLPHAVQFGVAFHLLDKKLLLVVEQRFQFHNAKHTGNENQTVTASVPGLTQSVVIPFDWRNVSSTKIAAEYQVSRLFAVRAGFNAAISATSDRFAQYFTPPPGPNWFVSSGVGFNWSKFDLDLASAVAWGGKKLGSNLQGQIVDVGGKPTRLCSVDQVTRTGCPGEYKVLTIWGSITGTYHM